MTPRFYVHAELRVESEVMLSGEQAHRLTRVRRLGGGDEVVLFNGSGLEYVAVLEAAPAGKVIAHVESERPGLAEPALNVTLYQAVVKGGRFEFVLEKGTELGVAAFVPLQVQRSVVKVGHNGSRPDRWRRVVIEAAEQCGRAIVPQVMRPHTLDDILTLDEPLLFPYEGERTMTMRQALDLLRERRPGRIGVLVGPEGGFEAAEVERARTGGALVVSLGPRILRSETAGIVATALVLYELGDLSPRQA